MRRLVVASLFLAVSLFASPARAALISYELLGHVTSVDSALDIYMPGIQVGMPIQGILGPYPPPIPPAPNNFGIDLFVAGYGICTGGPAQLLSPTTVNWSGSISLCEGSLAHAMLLDLLTLNAASLDPLTLPAALSFLGLDPLCLPQTGCTHTDRPGFSASIDSIASVPDTGSTFLLMLVAVGGLVLIKRRPGRVDPLVDGRGWSVPTA
jgi:hypothetical protein